MKNIKVWSNQESYLNNRKSFIKIFDKVSNSSQIILGPQVKNFENAFSKFTGNKYGVGVNSGTDALEVILMALGVGHGDEVITTSNTAVPTVSAIVSCNAKPVFVDVNEKDFLIDTSLIKKKITNKTKAIIVVNLYGQCVNFTELKKIIKGKKNQHSRRLRSVDRFISIKQTKRKFWCHECFFFLPYKKLRYIRRWRDGGN